MLITMTQTIAALHDQTSFGSKLAVGIGNGYSLIAALATNTPDWALVITPVATGIWLLARSYAIIKRVNHETRDKDNEKEEPKKEDSGSDPTRS